MRTTSRFLVSSLGLGLAAAGLAIAPVPAAQASPAGTGVIISEVFGGGSSNTTPGSKANDFIELYNPTAAAIPVNGWSVQYRSATGTSAQVTELTGEILPGEHYLIQEGTFTTPESTQLPKPDAQGGISMSGTNGVVLLVKNTDQFTTTGNLAGAGDPLVDMVGYGTTPTSFEGARTGVQLSTTTSAQRDLTAAQPDSDNNATDFTELAPTPVNSAGETKPVLDAKGPATLDIVQNQPMPPLQLTATGGTAPYTWTATTLPAGLTLSAAGELTGTPTEVGTTDVTFTVTDSASPADTDDVVVPITVSETVSVTPIHEVQGTGARSPFAPAAGTGPGETKTVEGIVTALYRTGGFNGFYLQTAGTGGTTDATPGASDALFVYTTSGANIPAGIEIGDSVRAKGPVSEFAGTTEITAPAGNITELVSPLDAVTGLEIGLPATEADREAQEGMLLAPTGPFTVTNTFQTNGNAEIGLAAGDVPLKQPTEFVAPGNTAGLEAIVAENAERAITLDDAATVNYLQNQTTKAIPLPWLTGTASPPRVGAAATFVSPVILEFRNNIWKFQPRSQVTDSGSSVVTFENTRATNQVPQDVGGDISIATFNVLNYFNTTGEAYAAAGPQQNPPLDTFCTYFTDRQSNRIGNDSCGVRLLDDPDTPQDESDRNDGRGPRGAATTASLARQEEKLVNTINAMDASVIALEEMENSIKLPGETNRDEAVAHLVQMLNQDAGSAKWKYVRSPGEALDAGPVAEQDVIRPAFIYQPDLVAPVGQSDILFGTTEFANAREPLAQAFKAAGAPNSDAFAVIVNHFKSKGDNAAPAPPATGDNANDPYVGAFNGDRVRQAERLVQFADDFASARDIEAVFLAGDFNSYTMEQPIQELEAGGFELIESDQPEEESYSFSGLSGSLDHVLGNAAAMGLVTGADIWEINANESVAYQYSRYNYNATILFDAGNPFATSDHNPEIVGLDLPAVTPTTTKKIQVVGTNDFHGRLLPDAGNAAGAAPFATAINELRAENPNTIFAAAGDLIGASTFESFVQDDEPTIEALNAMDLEVSAAGNHEFDRGYEDFVGRVQDLAEWEYIATNVDEPGDRDDLAETWSTTVDGVDVGFVGAVTEDLPALVNPAGIEGVTVTDIVDSTNAAAEDLRQAGADIVILLVHEGSPSTDCQSESFTDPATVWGNIVQNTSGDVDAIISGHTHLAYNCRYPVADWVTEGRTVTRRPVVSAGQYGTNLNQLVFNLDTTSGALVEIEQDVIGTAGVGYAPDPAVQQIVDDAVAFAETKGAEVLGQVEGPFKRATYNASSGATENRGGESTLGNLVAEVQRWATDGNGATTSADIAFMNPGGLRADMLGVANGAVRDLTYRQAADVQPFANTLVNMELTGAQLETVLEEQWQRTPQGGVPSRPFLRLGVSEGFTYTYTESPVTVTAPNSAPVNTFQGEVTGMWLDGEPIAPAATYAVTVNSFLGSGGDNFREFANGSGKVDTGVVDLQAMVDYMAANAPSGTPLPVDYSQRAVEVAFPNDAPTTYGPGDTLAFEVASWSMSQASDVKDGELEVRVGSQTVATVPVDSAVGNKPYDNTGTAAVSLTVPEGVAGRVSLRGLSTGTAVRLPATVQAPVQVAAADVTAPAGTDAVVEVTVTGAVGVPTGEIEVFDGQELIGSGSLTDGTAAVTIDSSGFAVGEHPLTAVYRGDSSYAQGEDQLTLTVELRNATVTADDVTIAYGEDAVAPVTVTGPGATPTGEVEVRDGPTVLGTGTLVDGAVDVTLDTAAYEPGMHPLTVSYAGDATHDGATAGLTLTVEKLAATVTGTDAVTRYGKATSMDVTVTTGGDVVPTGTITLTSGAKTLGSATLEDDGTATVTIPKRSLKPRDAAYPVTIAYSGDDLVAAATGSADLTVKKGSVELDETITPRPAKVDRTRAEVEVSVTNVDGVEATGRVTVSARGIGEVSARLVDGTATLRLGVFKSTGEKTIRISYDGSALLRGATTSGVLRVVR